VSALDAGWLPSGGRVLDVGCGLGTEISHLATTGWQAAGIDLSATALAQAAAVHDQVVFARTDVRQLPLVRNPHCHAAPWGTSPFVRLTAAILQPGHASGPDRWLPVRTPVCLLGAGYGVVRGISS
jgi:SAM-dependent methyltransferase